MSTTTQLVTAEELLHMPDGGMRRELICGEIREMAPAGGEHGKIAMRLGARLGRFVEEHELGDCYAAETGFRLGSDPDTVRAPDASFLCRERAAEIGDTKGYIPGAPDLAIEVISPSDTYAEVEEKVFAWLDAGSRMVIVVNPRTQSISVHRSRTDVDHLTEHDEIDGGDVVPGWSVPVREIFGL